MSAVRARSLDMSVAVMEQVMVPVRISVSMRMRMKVRAKTRIWMRVWMRIYPSVFDIPRADVGVAGFLTKTPFRSACKMVCRICFPAHVA